MVYRPVSRPLAPSRRRCFRWRRLAGAIALYGALLAFSAILFLPLAWMLATSLKTDAEVFSPSPLWLPARPAWENYQRVWHEVPFLRAVSNTLVVTISVILGRLASASLAAFAFARLRFRGRQVLFLIVLSTMMIPNHVTIIPSYILFYHLHWLDSFKPLIVPALLGGGAFSIFLLRQFFLAIPLDLDDAARIDGARNWQLYWLIALPMSKPALAAVAVFSFLEQWNDFLLPVIYLTDVRRHTLAVAMQFYRQQASGTMYGPVRTWAHLMAIALLAMLPCLIIFLAAQRYFMQGLVTAGYRQ